ncbi:unnamed protein product [Bemisia tabaci]|uniref:Integrase catalytic domain-containing protein n=2 Tax=Bemisia tabaci TaxID=7038 RepID=A0A9N9ZZ30_BEMTA|nr:unnamed protein product [Bemisia tabaci]
MDNVHDVINHDIQQLVNGLQQQNVFLIQQSLPNVHHHIQFLDTLLSQLPAYDEELISQTKNSLLQLVAAASCCLNDLLLSHAEDKGAAVAGIAELDIDVVLHLRKSGLPWSKIGAIFGLSRQSMYNFRKSNGIEEPNMNLDELALEDVLPSIMQSLPNAGAVMIRGVLLTHGFKINVNRVKEAMKRIDPFGVHLRMRQKIPRRVYSVPHPNYLWHIDGTHKLVMFRIVIHGCIDGFSRYIIFVESSTDNEAETVLQQFLTGVDNFGVPSRVRGDSGGENSSVRHFMVTVMGEGRGSFIKGPSVHNQRIERLWRDVNEQVSNNFKELFLFLESNLILDENNILDIFCLHYIFLPRISNTLRAFRHAWNKHSMRTEHGRTPEQLWLAGMLKEGFDMKLHSVCLDMSYDHEYWHKVHLKTFKLDFNENMMLFILNISLQIVPNPLINDSNSGVSLYVNLRSALLNQLNPQ